MYVEARPCPVDGVDRRFRIGVRGQDHPSGQRIESPCRLQQFDAGHLRHPLIGDQQRRLVSRRSQFAQSLQCLLAGRSTQDLIVGGVVAAQVAQDGGENQGIIIDREDHRIAHRSKDRQVGRVDVYSRT